MPIDVATKGNSVTLQVVFRDANNDAVDPDGDVTVRILDPDDTVLSTATIPLGEKTATGTFEHTITVPDQDTFDYEFSATVGGNVELGRRRVKVSTRTP